jgi:hypothetical protein
LETESHVSSRHGVFPGQTQGQGFRHRIVKLVNKIEEKKMTSMDNKVLDVLLFHDSREGHELWKKNKEKGMSWEDNVINLCLKAAYTPDIDELDVIFWRVTDILYERGIVRITA